MSLAGWIVAYLARWFHHRASTGLTAVGSPDRASPVLVTASFSLTVQRVRRSLAGRDLWLLVVPTDGVNVWCAAAGGIFTHQRVIDAIKVAGLAERVEHREVILPALCAPGVEREAIREATGFSARFGPVYARDIPEYLDAGKKKTEAMLRFRFDLRHRLEMLVPMNMLVYLLLAVVLAIFWPHLLLGTTLLFWGAVALLYTLVPIIPGRSGWAQALLSACAVVLGWGALDWIRLGDPLHHWGWYLATIGLFLTAGLDLAGTATARKSDPVLLLNRLGTKSVGSLLSEHEIGQISLERERCTGCRTCWRICPVGVYGELDEAKKTTFIHREACFNCAACVKQCPEGALSIKAVGARRVSGGG